MHRFTHAALGLALGVATTLMLGAALSHQPQPPADPVLDALARIERGLFKQDSRLPDDPDTSIEQMLEALGDRLAKVERTVLSAAGRPAGGLGLDLIETRLDDIERRLGGSRGPRLEELQREIAELGRSLEDVARKTNLPGGTDLAALERALAAVERRVDDLDRKASGPADTGRLERQLDSLSSRIGALERRIK